MIDAGETYSTGFESRDAAGALVNPTTYSCSLTLPDGTTVTPTLTNPSTGVLRLDYLTAQEGRHSGKVTTTIAGTTKIQAFEFDVSVARSAVSMADARTHLNFLGVDVSNDEELRFHLETATSVVESFVGPVARRTYTETIYPSGGMLYLSHIPVLSVASITSAYGYSGTYTVASVFTDLSAGVIQYGAVGTFSYPVTVTYTAGRVVVDPVIRMAVLDLVRMNWRQQQGGARSAFDPETAGEVRLGYFVPNSMLAVLRGQTSPPAVA